MDFTLPDQVGFAEVSLRSPEEVTDDGSNGGNKGMQSNVGPMQLSINAAFPVQNPLRQSRILYTNPIVM